MLRRLLIPILAALTACSGAPSERERTLQLFDQIAYLLTKYNAALASQEGMPLDAATSDLRRVATEEFDRLIAALEGEDAALRADAAFAIGFSRKSEAVAPLTKACASPDIILRRNAGAALGMLGHDAAAPAIGKLLEDPEPDVREAALFGLRALVDETRDHGLLPAVHARLADRAVGVRNEALILLRDMKRAASAEPILNRSVKDVEPLVRANAALALGAIGPAVAKAATPHLIEMLRDEESKVVESAWKALTLLNQKDFDRSYATWRDWYEDEIRNHWSCTEHRDVSAPEPGDCPHCRRKLERVLRETGRKSEPAPAYFACPDHPEVTTSTASNCGKPGCGKPLVAAKPPPVSFVCPDHPEVVTLGPSTCARPGCGKSLVPRK
ncbi:MAG TPA: HEAT repeat domain-containing protein [Planctomycetota bacterium]